MWGFNTKSQTKQARKRFLVPVDAPECCSRINRRLLLRREELVLGPLVLLVCQFYVETLRLSGKAS